MPLLPAHCDMKLGSGLTKSCSKQAPQTPWRSKPWNTSEPGATLIPSPILLGHCCAGPFGAVRLAERPSELLWPKELKPSPEVEGSEIELRALKLRT